MNTGEKHTEMGSPSVRALGLHLPQDVPSQSCLVCLLVIENDVWVPDLFRGNVNFFHAAIVVWIPF